MSPSFPYVSSESGLISLRPCGASKRGKTYRRFLNDLLSSQNVRHGSYRPGEHLKNHDCHIIVLWKRSVKHGGDHERVELNIETIVSVTPGEDLLTLDEALSQLEDQWPDKAELVTYLANLFFITTGKNN